MLRSDAPIIPKKAFLAGVVVASVAALSWTVYNALHHGGGTALFVPVHGAAILLALIWMVHAHYASLFAISRRAPGVLQVGLEVAVLSGLAFAVPWVIFDVREGPLTPAPWGALLLILSIPVAAAWVGVRARLRARTYVVAQSMLAALCFYPMWVLGIVFLGFAGDPGFSGFAEPRALRDVGAAMPLVGGPFFAAVALIVAEVARQIPRSGARSYERWC